MGIDWNLLVSSYSAVFSPGIILMICIGTAAGITMGALPGLTATMGVALLVPLTFGRPPLESISMLIGIYCGAMYGGAISAILIRTPGTPAAAATLMEGYPMAQRGEAGRAMSMALFASFFGGVVGALVMTFASPWVSTIALDASGIPRVSVRRPWLASQLESRSRSLRSRKESQRCSSRGC